MIADETDYQCNGEFQFTTEPPIAVERYLLVAENKDWSSAASHCESLNRHLVVIRNADEQQAVASYLSKTLKGKCDAQLYVVIKLHDFVAPGLRQQSVLTFEN